MNKKQAKRLLNVARALRESKTPEDFYMGTYVTECGTPACALGHYAARTDLQHFIKIGPHPNYSDLDYHGLLRYGTGYTIDFDDDESLDHFGIDCAEAMQLFSPSGCGKAKSPKTAAKYIERFVAKKQKVQANGH